MATAEELAARPSFTVCLCGAPFIHGYFRDKDGEKLYFFPITNNVVALKVLDILMEMGYIPETDEDAVINDIRLANLPDERPVDTLFGGPPRTASEKDARFSFRAEEGATVPSGRFFRPGGQIASLAVVSQEAAREILSQHVEEIPSAEHAALEEDIRTSGLPEDEPYVGPFTFVASEMGYIFRSQGGEFGVGSPVRSKPEARELLAALIKQGAIKEEEREGLLAEIEAAGPVLGGVMIVSL